jgi:poly-gamma-glutamate synthesis protein (capsule biosynthesis protein)
MKFKCLEKPTANLQCKKLQMCLLIMGLFYTVFSNSLLMDALANETVSANEISVLAVGDITISSRMTPLIERKGAGVFFQGITPLIQSADIATASLNASISERGEPRYGVEHPFRSAPGLGRAIANAGFDAVSLATPHIMDFGVEALEDTITELEWYNVKPIGAGTDAKAAKLPAWVEIDGGETGSGQQVALLAYYRVNAFTRYTEDPLAYAVYSEMTDAVKQAGTKADLVVVWLHWGKQGRSADEAIGRQRIFAHALIDAGANMVLCQQLHTFGGVELYQNKPIIYSLSDFIYDTYDKQHSHIVIPKATFNAGVLTSIELIPILTDAPKKSVRPGKPTETSETLEVGNQFPSILTGAAAIKTLRDYQRRCAELKTEVFIEDERGWIR